MKYLIQQLFNLFGLQVSRRRSLYGIWQKDPRFMELYDMIKDYSLVKIDRLFSIYQFIQYAKRIEGDVAELGVYKGGTAKLFAEEFKGFNKSIYLFDTFEGMPKDKAGKEYREDNVFDDTNIEDIRNYLKDYSSIKYEKGIFPSTTKGLEDSKFSLVYLDADLYESTREGLAFFYPRMVKGGVIIIDDYGSSYWPGVEKAVFEFSNEEGLHPIIPTWNQCVFIKPCH